jgi:ABC-type transporter Mla subunit MlaD
MSNTKYFIVGLFVAGGLILLAVLIVWFEGVAQVLRGGYEVRAHLRNSGGIRPGRRVHRDGLVVGQVADIESSLPTKPGVWLVMQVYEDERIPSDADFFAEWGAMGDVFLDFRTPEQPSGEHLPTDGTAVVRNVVVRPYSFLPEGIMEEVTGLTEGTDDFKALMKNLRELTEPRTSEDVANGQPANLSATLDQLAEAGRALKAFVEDPETRKLITAARTSAEELSTTLAKARESMTAIETEIASTGTATRETLAAARETADKADEMIARFSRDAEKAEQLVDRLTTIADDLKAGKGTAGKLLTEPELHDALLTLVENLGSMAEEAERLMALWREEGILAKDK